MNEFNKCNKKKKKYEVLFNSAKEKWRHTVDEENQGFFDCNTLPAMIQSKLHLFTEIDLSNCDLQTINADFSNIPLQKLNLSNNKLATMPRCLYINSFRIEYLDLSYNVITACPEPNCLLSLKYFDISNNLLKEMPTWIWEKNCRLKECNLSTNPIVMSTYGAMYKTYLSTSRLHKLIISNCKFTNADVVVLEKIPNLIYLNIGNDSDKSFRNTWDISIDSFDCKNHLEQLHASYLELFEMPCNINDLKALTHLILTNNHLQMLCDQFCQLTNLKVCDLTNNSIACLPNNINQLSNLEELYLAHNCLSVFPTNFRLKALRILDLYDNDLEEIDLNVTKGLQGFDVEQNYVTVNNYELIRNYLRLLRVYPRSDGTKEKIPSINGSPVDPLFDSKSDEECSNDCNSNEDEPEEVWETSIENCYTHDFNINLVDTNELLHCGDYNELFKDAD